MIINRQTGSASATSPDTEPYLLDFQQLTQKLKLILQTGGQNQQSSTQVSDQIYQLTRQYPELGKTDPRWTNYTIIKQTVMRYLKDVLTHDTPKDYGLGLRDWGDSGRGFREGPKYGYWCGSNWSAGGNPSTEPSNTSNREPLDSLDEACQDHDLCTRSCRPDSEYTDCQRSCDTDFVSELGKLDGPPKTWPRPPHPALGDTAAHYRFMAEIFFSGKILWRDLWS